MTISMLKGKIHRATVTQAELDYVGSITVDIQLLEDAGIFEYEKVQIVDVNNGARFETYTIAGERGSGVICLNGAAARMVQTNDKVIIMAYADVTPEEAKQQKPVVVFVDENNHTTEITNYEHHGLMVCMEKQYKRLYLKVMKKRDTFIFITVFQKMLMNGRVLKTH